MGKLDENDKNAKLGSRRKFLGALPAASVLYAVKPDLASAQAAATDAISAQADALAEVARLKYGTYLKEGDLADIKRVIERNLRYAEALAKVPISNSDEPDFMFIPNSTV